MSNLESKSKEELIEIVIDLTDQLEEKEQSVNDLQDEVNGLTCDLQEKNNHLSDQSSEKSFYAGFEAKEKDEEVLRSWLNYKIEAGIK